MNSITEGSLPRGIVRFAMPIAATSILQQLFNSADTAVVGRFTSTVALAAVGTNAEVVALLVSISSGLAVGLNVTIAWRVGGKKYDEIQGALHCGILLSAIVGILLLGVVLLAAAPLLSLIRTPAEALDQAILYLRLYALGLPFLLLYDFGCAVERARGNSRRPLYALVVSGILNVCLNLFFVIVFKLGVAGVALATDVSNAFSAGLTLHWLASDPDPNFRFSLRKLALDTRIVRSILWIGVPAALQAAIFCFSNIFVQMAINGFGSTAVAGSTAAMNFEYIDYYMVTAFAQTATTFTSQNQAAGHHDRCRRVLRLCILYGLLFGAAISVPLTVFCDEAASLYSTDPGVIAAARERMRIILAFTPCSSLYEVPAAYLRGYGRSLSPAIETILGTCVVRVAYIFTLFPRIHTLRALYLIFPVTWVITAAMIWASVAGLHRTLSRSQAGDAVGADAETPGTC